MTIQNSIVAGNTATNTGPDFLPDPDSILDVDYSLIGDTSGSGITAVTGTGNILDQAAGLGPLADNGGPTRTHALLPGSPAINSGNRNLLPADANDTDGDSNTTEPIPFDQRGAGFDRLRGGQIDMGAFEVQSRVGDFDGNGHVAQGDLDLVLLYWGKLGVPHGWINDLPDSKIDQNELDRVLLNWGNGTITAVARRGRKRVIRFSQMRRC